MIKTMELTLTSVTPEVGTNASLTDVVMREIFASSTDKGGLSKTEVEASTMIDEASTSLSGMDTKVMSVQGLRRNTTN